MWVWIFNLLKEINKDSREHTVGVFVHEYPNIIIIQAIHMIMTIPIIPRPPHLYTGNPYTGKIVFVLKLDSGSTIGQKNEIKIY